ncbi:MAG: GtrA family protein [Clostridia bacterium]|nr:GtrA family protein [Clostridia bacterium]
MIELFKKLWNKYFVQLRNFVIVGCTVTLLDFVLLRVLTEYLGIWYLASAIIAFILSTIINYILSMRFVFKGREGRDKKEEFAVFAVLNLIGLGLTTLLMWMLVDKAGLYYMLAKVFTSGTVMVWSFFSRKIFLEQKQTD